MFQTKRHLKHFSRAKTEKMYNFAEETATFCSFHLRCGSQLCLQASRQMMHNENINHTYP
jgi:hypothetical protein